MVRDTVLWTFVVIAVAIIIDAILGAVKAAVSEGESFDIRTLPKFLATGVLPYIGSLGIVALAAEFVGEPFAALFFAAAAAIAAKYVADIKDKLTEMFSVEINDNS